MSVDLDLNRMAELTDDELLAYDRRRRAAQDALRALGHGAGARASFDTKIAHATISGVLTGRIRNAGALDKIEQWLKEQA